MLEISEWRNSSSEKKNIKKNSFVVVTKPDKARHFCLLTDFSVSLSTKQNCELYAMLLGYKKIRLNSASKHTLPSPQYGQYLTHAYSHITRAVAAMDSYFAIIRLHQHTAELVVCAYWLYLVLFI